MLGFRQEKKPFIGRKEKVEQGEKAQEEDEKMENYTDEEGKLEKGEDSELVLREDLFLAEPEGEKENKAVRTTLRPQSEAHLESHLESIRTILPEEDQHEDRDHEDHDPDRPGEVGLQQSDESIPASMKMKSIIIIIIVIKSVLEVLDETFYICLYY